MFSVLLIGKFQPERPNAKFSISGTMVVRGLSGVKNFCVLRVEIEFHWLPDQVGLDFIEVLTKLEN